MDLMKELFLIIIGATIGFLSSIGTTIVTDLLSKKGEIKIYYKIVYSKARVGGTWGFHKGSSGMIFDIPIWIEILNTSNTVRVARDINILLYKDGREVAKMIQINKINDELLGNEGSYSFVVQPRSINKYDLNFSIKKNDMGEDYEFNEIRLCYFDEKEKIHIFLLDKIERCWELGDFNRDGLWKLAK